MTAQTLSTQQAFDRYEAVINRFPARIGRSHVKAAQQAKDLGELAERYDIFVFDAFGVLNVGERPIEGACERIDMLRSMGKRLFVLTNAASYRFSDVVAKFQRLGFQFRDEELISSRAVCESHLANNELGDTATKSWGVIAPKQFDPEELSLPTTILGDNQEDYDNASAFLFLSTDGWSEARQTLLVNSLRKQHRPVVIANPDLVAPREVGLTLEPGYYAQDLLDQFPDLDMTFHGKPFPSVYDRVEAELGDEINREKILMVGDSLHTDIWGADVRGWHSALVTDHGFLKGQDPLAAIKASGIYPDWRVPQI